MENVTKYYFISVAWEVASNSVPNTFFKTGDEEAKMG